MPEGHSIHRIARQFARHFVGKHVTASSPQGRFAAGAEEIDGRVMTDSRAVGKHLFLKFGPREELAGFEEDRYLHVHLGLYGAWDFAGDIDVGPIVSESGEESLASMGAPRLTRLRMSEQESESALEEFPPEPIGQVRVRLLTEDTVADLRGPTACEVLDAAEVQEILNGLGPDPMLGRGARAEQRFVDNVRKRAVAIGLLLMDQSVVAGIGNVYRAELLYRARIDPHRQGKQLTEEEVRGLWRDWVKLLRLGVETGQMFTTDRVRRKKYWVYQRAGEPCRTCKTPIVEEVVATRNLFYCPYCQV